MREVASSSEVAFSPHGWDRWAPLAGIAFVICFFGGVVASDVPSDNASDKKWLAAYAGSGHQRGHVITGFLLVYAAMLLMIFMSTVWARIRATGISRDLSPLPLMAAGVGAACMCVGGISMAVISGSELFSSMPEPSADLLRLGNDLGFDMVGVAGMTAIALCVACLSVQAHSAGLFSRRFLIFGLVVAVVLLGSAEFFPIAALLIWLIVVAIALMRGPCVKTPAPAPVAPATS